MAFTEDGREQYLNSSFSSLWTMRPWFSLPLLHCFYTLYRKRKLQRANLKRAHDCFLNPIMFLLLKVSSAIHMNSHNNVWIIFIWLFWNLRKQLYWVFLFVCFCSLMLKMAFNHREFSDTQLVTSGKVKLTGLCTPLFLPSILL